MPNADVAEGRYRVQSVARAAALLELVADAGPQGLGVTEMAQGLGVAKSTALSLARTLVAAGLLRSLEVGARYGLGLNLLRLGDLASQQTSIGELGLPVLHELSRATGMTARLAVNENGYPIFLERVDGGGPVRFHAPLGQREEPHCTAAGKAILAQMDELEVRRLIGEAGMRVHTPKTLGTLEDLLADLERIRQIGFAIDDEEESEGVFCAGAAFFDHHGRCAGALSVTDLKLDVPLREVQALGLTVREHAERLSTILSGSKRVARR